MLIGHRPLSGHPEYSRQAGQFTNKMDMRLQKFVEDFVYIYERYLSEFYERLEGQGAKSGKWANFVSEVIATGIGATESIEMAEWKAVSIVGLNIFQKVISSIGIKHNRVKLKKLINQLLTFKEDSSKVREELIKSGVEIFQNFESQFVQVTSNGSWKRAMTKSAMDAVARVFNYFRQNTEEGFSASSITKGIILGKSKKYKHTSTGIPHRKPGHTLEVKNSKSWNTAKLFDKAGLVTVNNDGTADKYYKKKDGSSYTSKYGYRLLFNWELENKIKKLDKDYEEEEPTNEEYRYTLKQSEKGNLVKVIMEEINKQDSNLMEKRLADDIKKEIEELEQEVEDNFRDLQSFVGKNFHELSNYVKNNQDKIKNELMRHHQKACQQREEIARDNKDEHKKTQAGIKDVKQKLDDIHNTVVTNRESKQERKQIWFDIRKSVKSFIGREEQLDRIDTAIKQGIIIINGLGGVGKSELAIKYANNYYGDKQSAIFINSETHDTAKGSFRRLLKELGVKTRDQDGDEKSLGLMAKEAYNFFAGNVSLFIFDNAKEYSIIKEFLPLNIDGHHVLITSQNLQLFSEQEHGKIETLSLDTLPEAKAIEFVKNELKISNTLQDKNIKELVEILGYLPLALQHVVAYIKESDFIDSIGSCVEIYKISEREIQSFLNREGLSSYSKPIYLTFKATIDQVKQEKNDKLAAEILNIIAYLASDNIPKEIFLKLAQDRDKKSDVCVDIANGMLMRAINSLDKYFIINLKEKPVSIHRLVQEVIRLELKKQSEEGGVLEEEVLGQALELLREYTKIPHSGNAASCIPHIISIWNYASRYVELIKSFIVDSANNKATTSTTYLNLIIEGSNYEVIDDIIKKINSNNLKEVINGKSKDDVTPLHKAVLRNDEKIVKLAIDGGADVNAKKSNGWTPLHLAAKNGNLEIVNTLLEKVDNVDDRTSAKYQFTPLHLAARNGHKEIVESLLRKNADINAKTGYQFTPLHLATDNGHLDVVQALLKNNQIIINAETKDKFSSLHLAAKNGHLNVVQVLLAKSPDLNTQNKNGFTPLHFAALNGHANIVDKLLENYKININARTNKGNTPLHLAAEKDHLKIVEALIEKSANIDIKNDDGNTASDLAHSEVKDHISSHIKEKKEQDYTMYMRSSN